MTDFAHNPWIDSHLERKWDEWYDEHFEEIDDFCDKLDDLWDEGEEVCVMSG